ncbi:MAG: hypothetical protein ACKOZX_01725 [Gammaproteobacteria bacterium]
MGPAEVMDVDVDMRVDIDAGDRAGRADSGAAATGEAAPTGAVETPPGAELCAPDALHIEGPTPAWEARLRDTCRCIMADTGGFVDALAGNVPGMMFATLPLLAALMQVI